MSVYIHHIRTLREGWAVGTLEVDATGLPLDLFPTSLLLLLTRLTPPCYEYNSHYNSHDTSEYGRAPYITYCAQLST